MKQKKKRAANVVKTRVSENEVFGLFQNQISVKLHGVLARTSTKL